MITISAQSATLAELDVDVVAVGVFKGGIEAPGTVEVLDLLGLDDIPTTPTFRGDVGQTLLLGAPGRSFGSVLLVGLGRMDHVSPQLLRHAAGDVMRAVPKASRVATTLAMVHPTRGAIEAVADGLQLGAYTFDRYRGSGTPAAEDVEREAILVVPSSTVPEAEAAIQRSRVSSRSVAFARDLVNTPGGDATPAAIADAVRAHADEAGGPDLEIVVHEDDWLAEQGFGAMLGVARAAANRPRLVELRHRTSNPLAHVVLVGKGITFDTGGLNLKPGAGMIGMKADMGGAAAVAAAVTAISQLGARVDVTGFMGLTENAIGGDAQRPSDVVTAFDGTRIEVGHTDAEGRLVLADVLGYAASLQPDVIIDLATLTGSAVRALGPYTAALMSNDEDLAAAVTAAAGEAGEPVWRMPLPEDLDRWLDTAVGDLAHVKPDDGPDVLMAGLFLQRFVDEVPWAHLDIAGPADVSKAHARGHQPEGGTGYGVTTLLAYLQQSS